MKELTLKETMILSPIEKHVLYNRFPTRLFLNLILLVLVTLQVTFIFDFTAAYPRETERAFRFLFLNSGDDESLIKTMNSPKDVQDHLGGVQDVFQNFKDYMFQDVNIDTTQFQLHAYYKYPIERKETYDIDPNVGFSEPFNVSEPNTVKNFFQHILQMEITITNFTTRNLLTQNKKNSQNQESNAYLCLNWTINILYDAKQFTQITAQMTTESLLCSASIVPGSDASIGLSLLVLIFSTISLVRVIAKFLRIGRIFVEVKSAYINYVNHNLIKDMNNLEMHKQELMDAAGENLDEKMEDFFRYQSWEDVPFSAKMGFFNGWFIFNAVGNLFQVTSSMLLAVTFFSPITSQGFYIAEVTLGFSAFCTWMQLLQYLGFWKDLTLITTTIRKQTVPLIVFFAICLPIFTGIAFLGYSLFWKYDKFTSVGQTMRTLFALSCGDIVHETFLDTWGEGLVSMLFLMMYIVLYYTAFVNIFIAIIMEGYVKAEIRKQIDNDDPFPQQENLTIQRKMSLEIPNRAKESRSQPKGRPEIQKHLSKDLSNPRLTADAKNTMNLLMYQNEEVKEELEDLMKIKNVIEKRNYDEKTRGFLENLLQQSVNKIIKKITYYELMLKKSLESRHFDDDGHQRRHHNH